MWVSILVPSNLLVQMAVRRYPYCVIGAHSGTFFLLLHVIVWSVLEVPGRRKTRLFGKIWRNVPNRVFSFSGAGNFSYDKQLRRYTLYIVNIKTYGRCCQVDKTTGRCVAMFPKFPSIPLPYSQETQPLPFLRCHVNVATPPQLSNTWDWKNRIFRNFFLFSFFHILSNSTVSLWGRTYVTPFNNLVTNQTIS